MEFLMIYISVLAVTFTVVSIALVFVLCKIYWFKKRVYSLVKDKIGFVVRRDQFVLDSYWLGYSPQTTATTLRVKWIKGELTENG